MTPSFLTLSEQQKTQLDKFANLLFEQNQQLNLVSKASSFHIPERHILHSLMMGLKAFPKDSKVVDWGTGGGLPGIPLAIIFPDVSFTLIDSTLKKLRAVETMANSLGLSNVAVQHIRAEKWQGKANFAVSRATAPLKDLWTWTQRILVPIETNAQEWISGLICLKGGDLSEEKRKLLQKFPSLHLAEVPISNYLQNPYFESKYLLSVAP